MDFWESFSKTVSEAAEYTAREAGKLTGIAKLKYKISTCKARLNNLFESLGRLKYDELKGNAASETYSYDELVDKIDKVKAELESYENDLAKLKNERLCVSCRAVIGLDMTFCPRCGAKQPEPEKKDECCCDCDDNDTCCCDCDDNDACCDESADGSCCCDCDDTDACCDEGDDGSCCCDEGDETEQ
ncbi:MAG: hypothetical protein ACOYID_00610 [Eubacteriales bacterium]|jgi:hypothetical protein|nr:hypothetical protein [Clostridiales bacterium]